MSLNKGLGDGNVPLENHTEVYAKRNFIAFLWHALFLAFASNFTDINTIIPTMMIRAGGTPVHLGILTAIMVGGASFMQLVFVFFLARKREKKKYLLLGIYLRVSALLGLGFLLGQAERMKSFLVIGFIFLLISVFSFSGSFAGISYTDILGKSLLRERRKTFFVLRQTLTSTAVLFSAFLVRKLVRSFGYPVNYSILFLSAGSLLFIASLGFWYIKEKPTEIGDSGINEISIVSAYRRIFREDRNVRYFLFLINAGGLGLTIVPFYVSLAKESMGLSAKTVGNFLVLQIIGMVVSNILWNILVKRRSYKGLVKVWAIIGFFVPLLALFFSGKFGIPANRTIYPFIFLVSGFNISAYQIAIPGILLEISHEENRVLYTALSGAGSITTIVIPLISGVLISSLGYKLVFIVTALSVLSTFFFASRLNCSKS